MIAGNITLRLKGSLDFKCQLPSTDVKHNQKVISSTFDGLCSQVKSESLVFRVCKSPVFIWPNKGGHATPADLTPQSTCKDLQQLIQKEDQESKSMTSKTKYKTTASVGVINLTMMTEVTEPKASHVSRS
ncbi:hypothetical protein UPYG_G00041200 [Umbra pygmaea]|uniref:UFSP2 second domain-containing protein n=1 Tax=Umbra pygmaea TaxID=75934 RepID=A0ABD0XQ41_UMBPY